MTRFRCARCDWQSEDPDATAGHAELHPRCVLCGQSLKSDEQQTCTEDLGRVRANLRDIADLYALLPATLGHLGSNAPRRDATRHGDGSERLPGGDALVMLAGGSEGLLWAGPPKPDDPAKDEYAATYACRTCGQDHIRDRAKHLYDVHQSTAWTTFPEVFELTGWVPSWPVTNDNLPGDTPSVVFELARIEDTWRDAQHHPPATGNRTVTSVTRYLSGKPCEWAARWHDPDPWQDNADEISRIRAALVRPTGTSTAPETREARCINLDCTGCDTVKLERGYGDNGRADYWSCPRCRRQYTQHGYHLALAATLARRGVVA